jgi:hypothetical protein
MAVPAMPSTEPGRSRVASSVYSEVLSGEPGVVRPQPGRGAARWTPAEPTNERAAMCLTTGGNPRGHSAPLRVTTGMRQEIHGGV